MCAEIQHRSLVDLRRLVLWCVYLRVVLHEVADPLHKVTVLFLHLEILLLWQIRQAYQEVHQDGNLEVCLLEHPKHGFHQLHYDWSTIWACFGSWDRLVRVDAAWMIFARRAEPKSREKWWIFSLRDFLMRLIIQLIMSCSMKAGITVSFTEHFWSKAKQNLWMTDPFSCSFKI